jgi:serine/threonine protein kinase
VSVSLPQRSLDLEPGQALGKYEVMRKIATGGMAEIYLARVRGTAGFEKIVVLKRILPHIAQDASFRAMFLDEARLAATLQHPNIADVYDVGEFDGELFFTMEYIHGQDVRTMRIVTRKQHEHIPLAIGLAIIHGTASALDYAHDKRDSNGVLLGLVHRDVSSSNVILSYDGAIKLLDFGIARATVHQHKTQTGTLKGKIPYMSPEQCRGQVLDRRSDLFSLGVLMFELTVGRRPFRGTSDFEIMDQIVNQGAPAPTSLVTGYPPELEAIVLKLLARDPAARFQTADELLHELDPFLAQHRLWVSTKPLGKYMRGMFEERISAWERAESEGISLGQYVADSITSQSQKSELLTPPSAFPGLVPLSQEMPAVAAPDPAAPISVSMAAEKSLPIYPARPSKRRFGFVIAGLLAGLAGIAGFYVWDGRGGAAQVSAPASHPEVHAETPAPVPEPAAAPPAAAVPARAPTVTAPAEPGTTTPAAEPAPAVATETAAEPPADPPAPPVARTVKPAGKPTKAAVKPVVKPVVKPRLDPKTKKEGEWDPNSPFLPPS